MTTGLQKGLADWHSFVETGDMARLKALVHAEAVLHSPSGHTPYGGQLALMTALGGVMRLFQDFRYHREFMNVDESSVVLEFSASIEGRALKGVDIIRFDADGKLIELEVAIRPVAMALRLAELMGEMTGHIMPDTKIKHGGA